MSKAAENVKTTKFDENRCQVFDIKRRVIARSVKTCIYYLELTARMILRLTLLVENQRKIFGTGIEVTWGCKVSKNLLVTA